MKKHILLISLAILLIAGKQTNAQGICDPSGNILIYSNYDGGTFTINIDENIPNIRIGLCSYEQLNVTITGTYADNVVQVLYAGYNSGGGTSVSGVDAGIVEILEFPPVTLFDVDGYAYMICAYECDTDYVPGGCNTVDQAVDYFSTYLDGNIRYSYFQYGVFSGTEDMSDGGNCCLGAEPCAIVVDAGQDASICVGDSVMLDGSGAVNYVWFPDVALSDDGIYNPYSTPETTITYILTGSDADGCSGLDSVTVFVNPYPVVEIMDMGDGNLMATGGGSYQWYLNGEIIPGAINETYVATTTGYYAVEVTSDAGCTVLTEEIIVQVDQIANHYLNQQIICYPNPVNNELHITTSTGLQIEQVEIYAINGQLVLSIADLQMATNSISVEKIPAGLYTIKVLTNEGIAVKQIVVE